jgi:hypothetical protein
MDIISDTRDWTFVLGRQCPECGFDAPAAQRDDLPHIMREGAAQLQAILSGREDARERPGAGVWSPVEYGCHVRDMFKVFDGRLQRMLAEDDPAFSSWDHEETAVAERYWEQDPETVSREIGEAVEGFAGRLDAVGGDAWQRAGRRSDGVTFTVETLARYLVHDQRHHIWDVTGRRQERV